MQLHFLEVHVQMLEAVCDLLLGGLSFSDHAAEVLPLQLVVLDQRLDLFLPLHHDVEFVLDGLALHLLVLDTLGEGLPLEPDFSDDGGQVSSILFK